MILRLQLPTDKASRAQYHYFVGILHHKVWSEKIVDSIFKAPGPLSERCLKLWWPEEERSFVSVVAHFVYALTRS